MSKLMLTRIVALSLSGYLAGCATNYKAPTQGPIALLQQRSNGKDGCCGVVIYKDTSCENVKLAKAQHISGFTKSASIAANKVQLLKMMHVSAGMVNYACEAFKTFVPAEGKTYVAAFSVDILQGCKIDIYRKSADGQEVVEPTAKAFRPADCN